MEGATVTIKEGLESVTMATDAAPSIHKALGGLYIPSYQNIYKYGSSSVLYLCRENAFINCLAIKRITKESSLLTLFVCYLIWIFGLAPSSFINS